MGLILGLSLVGMFSCSKDKHIPDVSSVEVDLELVRFEKEMYGVDSNDIPERAKALAEAHPEFVEIYASHQVMRERGWADSSNAAVLEHLMRGSQMKMLHDTCMTLYDDFSEYETGLAQAFRYFKYYFPDKRLPKIYTCITEFAYQGFTYGPEVLVIGTEHYMGREFPAYRSMFPQYQYKFFTPEHLVSSTMLSYITEILGDQPKSNLLDEMIREGKELYILDRLMPHTPDSIKLNYTAAQAEWMQRNELEIWKFFVNEDLIYSDDRRAYGKYIMPSPNSPGMPPESPGRTASWIGWRIVEKYMAAHPGMTLRELVGMKDAQRMLKMSRYRGE